MDESGSQYDEEYPEEASNKSYSEHSYGQPESQRSENNENNSRAS